MDEHQQSAVMIVIEKNNLDRMFSGDPITIGSVGEGGIVMQQVKYPANMSLLIAYCDDEVGLHKAMQDGARGIALFLKFRLKWRHDPETDGLQNVTRFGPLDDPAGSGR